MTFLKTWWLPIALALIGIGTIAWLRRLRAAKSRSGGGESHGTNGLSDLVSSAATAVTAVAAAATAIVAIVTVNDTSRATREANQATRDQLRLAQQGQVAEGFSRAVELLAGQDLNDRLGGVYALDRVMKNPTSDTDESAAVDVLCAFVRQHTAHPPAKNIDGAYVQPADVQVALTVLGRRPNFDKRDFGTNDLYGIVDLRGELNLQGIELPDAHLPHAKLVATHLDVASFSGADLRGAYLSGSVLYNTDLTGAHLEGARLDGVYMDENTKLKGAHLNSTILTGAFLARADLRGTVGLTSPYIKCAMTDNHTHLPRGVSVSRTGCKSR